MHNKNKENCAFCAQYVPVIVLNIVKPRLSAALQQESVGVQCQCRLEKN